MDGVSSTGAVRYINLLECGLTTSQSPLLVLAMRTRPGACNTVHWAGLRAVAETINNFPSNASGRSRELMQ